MYSHEVRTNVPSEPNDRKEHEMKVYAFESRQLELYSAAKIRALIAEQKAAKQ